MVLTKAIIIVKDWITMLRKATRRVSTEGCDGTT